MNDDLQSAEWLHFPSSELVVRRADIIAIRKSKEGVALFLSSGRIINTWAASTMGFFNKHYGRDHGGRVEKVHESERPVVVKAEKVDVPEKP